MKKYPDYTKFDDNSVEKKVYYIIASSDVSYELLHKYNVDSTTQRIFFTKLTWGFLDSPYNIPNKSLEECVGDYIRFLIMGFNLKE